MSRSTALATLLNRKASLHQRFSAVAELFGYQHTDDDTTTAYIALMSQTGTAAPTVDGEVVNEIGAIVWTRNTDGVYHGTLAGAFAGKSIANTGDVINAVGNITYSLAILSDNVIVLTTAIDGVADDVLLDETPIEIFLVDAV